MEPLVSQNKQPITYLRLSVTDKCQLRCFYCAPHSRFIWQPHEKIMRYEEMLRIINIMSNIGVEKIRITGGEPLLKKDIARFMGNVVDIPGIKDVSLTTNGILLGKHLQDLMDAGIKRINISLDTLNPAIFKNITGVDAFQVVSENIVKSMEMGFHPVKLNVVAMKDINDNEIIDFAKLTMNMPFNIRFIEFMPIGPAAHLMAKHFLAVDEIIDKIKTELGPIVPIKKEFNKHQGPATLYRLENSVGELGFISAMSHHFCETCNRIRLTCDGKLRPCLLNDIEFDLLSPIRMGAGDNDIEAIIRKTALLKSRPATGNMTCIKKCMRPMINIGG